MRRTKEAAGETRDRILDAAAHVFAQRGVAGAALSDIADAARVTRGAIYWHFKNKCDLYTAMVDRIVLPIEALVAAIENPHETNPLSRIRDALITSLKDAVRQPHARRVLNVMLSQCDAGEVSDPALERCRIAARRLFSCLPGALRDAMRDGELPPDVDAEYAAKILRGLWTGVLHVWLIDPPATASDANAERIADTWLDMLRYSPSCRMNAQNSSTGHARDSIQEHADDLAKHTSNVGGSAETNEHALSSKARYPVRSNNLDL